MRSVMGLEIHVQLSTKTKAFCSCKNDVNSAPNTNICPVCTGQPGALPVLNDEVVEYAIKAALALNCEVHEVSSFDRKNYFYPDLPKGYQITQYFHPIATNGYLELDSGKKIRIRRIHIEEDSGKMFHSSETITEAETSLVDLNRCGIPLIEIVTEPDLEKPEEAREFMEKLRDILRAIGVSTGNMEEGALRCDANVSVHEGDMHSSRVEVKNINSFKFVQKALEYEIGRISQALKRGENVPQETRGWNFSTKSTVSMRTKEEENDYRYFPEPDLPILVVSRERIDRIKRELPELPDERAKRYEREMKIKKEDARILAKDVKLSHYFEEMIGKGVSPKDAANWIVNDLLALFNTDAKEFDETSVPVEKLKEIIDYTNSSRISRLSAKEVLSTVYKEGKDPQEIIKEKNLLQVSNEDELKSIVKKVLEQNPQTVQKYKNGKTSVIGFFIGAVMKETKGKADPKVVAKIAKKILDGEE